MLRHEQLRQKPDECLASIWQHLDVAHPKEVIIPLERHNGSYKAPMSQTARQHLRHLFWQEIGQLETLLGWDCSAWLQK